MLIYCGLANTISLSLYILFDRLAVNYNPQFKYGCVIALIFYGITYGYI